MKAYKLYKFLWIFILIPFFSCQDFLEENSVSFQTTDNYYIQQEGYEDLINSLYPGLRSVIKNRNLVFMGTDIFTSVGWNQPNEGPVLHTYDERFNSNDGSSASYWRLLYSEIQKTNTALSRKDKVLNMDENLLNIRVGEAKFLRALWYFYLVQQFGDIPMPLEETTTAAKEVEIVPAAEVYSQILKDLEEAEQVLPEKGSTDYGRATKGAAQFLLARVYLTRGWNYDNSLGGSESDFNKAVEYADLVIAKYPLEPNYKNLFPLHSENPLLESFPDQNDKNDEIVLAVQYSDDVLTYGGGNDYHSIFGGDAEDIPGSIGRTNDYNRHGSIGNYIVAPATYRLFDPELDTRYEHNFVEAMYALADVNNFVPNPDQPENTIDISIGDTVLYFPPWNNSFSNEEKGMDVGGDKRYGVLNIDEIGITDGTPYHTDKFKTPLMWKFWQPGIPYSDAEGTFDFALFRSAEAYLIAAEAIYMGADEGDLGSAESYYNSIVDRALGGDAGANPERAEEPANLNSLETVSYKADGNLDIDMILDERARELMGEYTRWYDLKRTGKLIERTSERNPWTAKNGEMQDFHYLRPIPQSEIDRTQPSINQNPGY